MTSESVNTLYPLVIGTPVDSKLVHTLATGYAVLEEGANHYLIRLMMFPGNTYYLSKNHGVQDRYTVFAKRFKMNGGEYRFQNPIGSGRLHPDVKTHLEIFFPILRTSIFMSLFPKNQ